jgi:hypothetical protein
MTEPMNEQRAREILGALVQPLDELIGHGVFWAPELNRALLGDNSSGAVSLSADELEAIAWWMRHKKLV